ncbi:MAG: carbohydrate ABC transporter permease [Lachnospiraceae bacterium]
MSNGRRNDHDDAAFYLWFTLSGWKMDFSVFDESWLSIPNVNTFIMIMTGIWQGIGLNMLLFISGLRNMDYTPVEASMIDGAGGLTLYTKVILPLLRPTIIVVLLMSLVNSFKVFDSIWL